MFLCVEVFPWIQYNTLENIYFAANDIFVVCVKIDVYVKIDVCIIFDVCVISDVYVDIDVYVTSTQSLVALVPEK